MLKVWITLIFLFLTAGAYAQQKIPVQEGIEVSATLSKDVLNRIAIENDKIMTVKGVTGQFEFDKDTELGQIFLKPVVTDKDELIHLFLITEKGHTYPLSLMVEEGSARSILLMPVDDGKGAQWEQSSSYETLLRSLVQAMVNETPVEGFRVERQPSTTPLPKIAHAKVNALQTYQGHKLQGQILEVTNTHKKEITLIEQDFYQKGVRAVAILNPFLRAHAKTLVYMVR